MKNNNAPTSLPKPSFGIVAALTNNHVIGINGGLPWEFLPQDLEFLNNLIRDKVFILGRKSFFDGGDLSLVRACIVVSRTLDESEIVLGNGQEDGSPPPGRNRPKVRVARSFEEALEMASQEMSVYKDCSSSSTAVNANGRDGMHQNKEGGEIECWIGGGERIYQEALQHDSCKEVHLSHVDMTVDLNDEANAKKEVAYFPMDSLEGNGFEEVKVSRVTSGICTFCLYKRPTAK